MRKFEEIYESVKLMLNENAIKLKSKKKPLKTIKVKSKKGDVITITARPSINNYIEYSIEHIDPETHDIYTKIVYLKTEVYTYLNDIIKASDKVKLNDLPSITDLKISESGSNIDKLSVKSIENSFRDIDEDGAKEVYKLMKNTTVSNKKIEINMEKINKLIDGYGVEAVRGEDFHDNFFQDSIAIYVNMGDTYAITILYDVDEREFIITSIGDWMESKENQGIKIK